MKKVLVLHPQREQSSAEIFLKQNLTDSVSVSDECAYANNYDQDEEAEQFPETGRLFDMISHIIRTY